MAKDQPFIGPMPEQIPALKELALPGTMYSNQHILEFSYVPSKTTGGDYHKVAFPAMLQDMSDAFTSAWSEHEAYGRMDSIATFMNTRRTISLAWNIPANSFDDAQRNMQKINKLIGFMYPTYSEVNNIRNISVINIDPYLRLKFGNLIYDAKNPSQGLLGYVNGFTFDPDIDLGFFYNNEGDYYPKSVRLNCEFTVLHEHRLGFKKSQVTKFVMGSEEAGKKGGLFRTTKYSLSDDSLDFSTFPYQVPALIGEMLPEWVRITEIRPDGTPVNASPTGLPALVALTPLEPAGE